MGHSHYAYDYFDESLADPLDGYRVEFEDGSVPDWVIAPTVQETRLKELLGIPYDEEIGRGDLPPGATEDTSPYGSDVPKYDIPSEEYLALCRERQAETAEGEYPSYDAVRFELNMKGSGVVVSHATGSGPTVPEDIRERLDAVTQTAEWDRQIDGYNEHFCQWDLVYSLDQSGDIEDVQIEADTHH